MRYTPSRPVDFCLRRSKSLLGAVFVVLFLFAQNPAHAEGYWSLHVTGTGSAKGTPKKTASWTPPADAAGSISLGSVGVGGTATAPGTASASAGISATITGTWIPDPTMASDPAPNVIVTISSTAYANGTSSGAGGAAGTPVAGTADDGLGQNDPIDTGATEVGTVDGTAYKLNPAGNTSGGTASGTFTITVSPSASASAVAGPSGVGANGLGYTGVGICSAGVGPITVSTTSPMVTLSGTYNPAVGDNRVLTGQQITATLTGTIGTVTAYTWTQPSGTCFKTYNPSLASNQLVLLATTDLTGPAAGGTTVAPLAFYDRAQESIVASCAVTMLAPDGKTSLNITANSPAINVLKPTAKWGIDPTTIPAMVNGVVKQEPNPVGFVDYSSTKSYFSFNTTWYLDQITVPTPFVGGTGCFAQLVTPSGVISGTVTGTGAPVNYALGAQLAGAGSPYTIPPGTGLDGGFPYGFGLSLDANGNLIPPGATLSSTWNAAAYGGSGDQPLCPEDPAPVGSASITWTAASFAVSCHTWMMYQPPGSNSVWVPLMDATWSGHGSGSANPTWSATGTYTSPSNETTNTFPEWTAVISAPEFEPH
jgi:hypothetical protein